ncbi:hypothetical protein [Lysobacter niastensis]|uniref:Uncharacterized protein n=1 Tax=Lysobacter niastensis TaxID=380629 RepID=A0ABS0B927_9GAMM|nr:hypothetical protein [Lysobacter niastensis]MBF6024154.1 hypothetical protein [Lysobacter niastensis]
MSENRNLRRAKACFWLLLVGIYSVATADVVIDVINGEEYHELSAVAAASADSPAEVRAQGAAQIAAIHRARSGSPFSSLPPGSTFKVVWPDGSTEYVQVLSPISSAGVQVVDAPQTQALAEQAR